MNKKALPKLPVLPKHLLLLVLLLAALSFFAGIFRGEVFGFRDASHFYQPLYLYESGEDFATGWNPHENFGQPFAADPTVATFYPGKLLFQLPLAYNFIYNAYILLHFLLGGIGIFLAARRLRCSAPASGLAVFSYLFGGYVLAQQSNVIFLVGAAWLPWAFIGVDTIVRRSGPKLRAVLGLAGALAMMTLGGDVQTAYHVGILSGIYACVVGLRRGKEKELAVTLSWLALAGTLAVGLAAVQVIPSVILARQSDRCDEAHDQTTYNFSVAPERLAEFLWPNLYGCSYPNNSRWIEGGSAENYNHAKRLWTPTLYAGLLPFLLALAAMRLRRGNTAERALSWTALFAFFASLGWWGAGAILQNFGYDGLEGPTGGLYWLMNHVLPGYSQFRYPAKWGGILALALALLAARGMHRLNHNERRISRRLNGLTGGLLLLSLLGIVTAVVGEQFFWERLQGTPSNQLFGPLLVEKAWWKLLSGFTQTTLVLLLFLYLWKNFRQKKWERWFAPLVLLLTAVELVLANAWVTATVEPDCWEIEPVFAKVLQPDANSGVPPRVYFYLQRQLDHTSLNRHNELVQLNQWTSYCKMHLPARAVDIIDVEGSTLRLQDFAHFTKRPWSAEALRRGSVQYLVTSTQAGKPFAGLEQVAETEGLTLWRVKNTTPRAYLRGAGSCKITDYASDTITVEVQAERPSSLILNEQYYPLWEAEVDGQPAPVVRTDDGFRRVKVPAGKSNVVFQYNSCDVRLGSYISLACLVVFLFFFWRTRCKPLA